MSDEPKRGLFQLQLITCFFLMIAASLLLFINIQLYANGYLNFEIRSWILFVWFHVTSLLSVAITSEGLFHKQPGKNPPRSTDQQD